MDMFIFFKVHKSCLFHRHLKSQLINNSRPTPLQFNEALKAVKDVILSILLGTIRYDVLSIKGLIDLDALNIDHEFKIFDSAIKESIFLIDQGNFYTLRHVLEIFKLSHHLQTLKDILERFGLRTILEDPEFVKFYRGTSIYREEKDKVTIKLLEARAELLKIKNSLCIQDQNDLEILSHIKNSPELFKFIIAKSFYGDVGLNSFRQQYQLITTQLQHMEYDENVLNNLPAAIKLISPFYWINQSNSPNPFKNLMRGINDNLRCGSRELHIINKNMALIQRWFSHANVRKYRCNTVM